MHSFTEERILPYNYLDLYNIVLDIEKYPEFIPWCSGARIKSKSNDEIIADLVVSFKAFTEKYTSKVNFFIDQEEHEAQINVVMIEGPFKYLTNKWVFVEFEGKTIIRFEIEFAFKSFLLDKLIGAVFDKAQQKLIEAFEKRAHKLSNQHKLST